MSGKRKISSTNIIIDDSSVSPHQAVFDSASLVAMAVFWHDVSLY